MSDSEVKANALLFLVAGFSTTAAVLSFSLFYLAANPDVLLKAQKEVDEKLGKVGIDASYIALLYCVAFGISVL